MYDSGPDATQPRRREPYLPTRAAANASQLGPFELRARCCRIIGSISRGRRSMKRVGRRACVCACVMVHNCTRWHCTDRSAPFLDPDTLFCSGVEHLRAAEGQRDGQLRQRSGEGAADLDWRGGRGVYGPASSYIPTAVPLVPSSYDWLIRSSLEHLCLLERAQMHKRTRELLIPVVAGRSGGGGLPTCCHCAVIGGLIVAAIRHPQGMGLTAGF